jgi:hypothetical protein
LHFLIERLERLAELGIDRLTRCGPFDEHGEIVALLAQRLDQIAVLFEAAAALENFLGFALIFPKVWRRGARLEASEFFVWAGSLKDSSASRRLVCSDLRNGASARRDSTWSRVPFSYCTRRRASTSSTTVAQTDAYAKVSPIRM